MASESRWQAGMDYEPKNAVEDVGAQVDVMGLAAALRASSMTLSVRRSV